jgi:hypothetical protein
MKAVTVEEALAAVERVLGEVVSASVSVSDH